MIEKQILEDYLRQGLSTRKIADITEESKSNIQYTINKYGLNGLYNYHQNPSYNFDIIDTPEKAYSIGFILCDGYIDKKNNVEISTCLNDSCIIEFISNVINSEVNYDYTFNRKARRFPRARSSKKINDIKKFIAGPLKQDRHFPIIKNELEKYLLLGVFDADGCITWGWRKDRSRIWHKITIKSSYNILYGVQQFLFKKLNISSIIHPVKNENCFVLEFSDIKNVIDFIDYLYIDTKFIVLSRKYFKARALRLELEENGEIYPFDI